MPAKRCIACFHGQESSATTGNKHLPASFNNAYPFQDAFPTSLSLFSKSSEINSIRRCFNDNDDCDNDDNLVQQ